MLEITNQNGVYEWKLGDRVILRHTKDEPFATAVIREKTYTTDRGTVKEEIVVKERIPLADLEYTPEGLCFTGGGISLVLKPFERKNGLALVLYGPQKYTYEFTFPKVPGEPVFGGGEQYRQLNLQGEHVKNLVSEHIKAKTVLEKAFLPRALYKEKTQAEIGTYAPMPVFIFGDKTLVLVYTNADGLERFENDRYVFTYDGCPDGIVWIQEESYEALGRALAKELPNHQYLPDWCHDGMIVAVQGGTDRILETARAMKKAGIKVSGIWSQDWSGCNRTVMGYQVYWNWEADETLYHDLKDCIRQLREMGIRFLAYINPYLLKDSKLYNYCNEQGYLIKRQDGSIYHIKSTTFDAGMLDLTNPEAVAFTKDVLIKKNMLDLGIAGWMADFGEYLPLDCVLHRGDPKTFHNYWPVLWAKLNREAVEEYGDPDVFFFTRSGYSGVQEFTPIMWNGDQHTDTTKDYGMPCIMPASFNLGFSGLTLVHSDVGGFFSFGKLKRNSELVVRWMEMCALSPLMRSHESIRPWANAQPYDKKTAPYTARLSAFHAALKPYVKKVVEEAREGLPSIRPDFYASGDFQDHHDEYAYFFGGNVFVAPVIERKAKTRKVYLPAGRWVSFADGRSYDGGQEMTFAAELGVPTAFYREESAYKDVFRKAAELLH